jgi:hypothetical protein
MALITRRRFARQTALAAALYGCPLRALGSLGLIDADQQNGAPLDAEAIRTLVSHIDGHVITPEASDYDPARSIFNRAFDRHPAVIVRCAGPLRCRTHSRICPDPALAAGCARRRSQPAGFRDVRRRRGY